jgi:hypothetical protein
VPVALIVQIEQAVGEKRLQEAREQVALMLFAVAIVVLEAIALGLARIVVLVLDLPAVKMSTMLSWPTGTELAWALR